MRKKLIPALIGLLALLCAAPLLAADAVNPAAVPNPNDPSVNQVYDEARAGHLDQARQMMNQVLANHPRSARAHYVAAELDADMKNYGEARQELKTAEDLQPGLPFANASAVAALKAQIGLTSGAPLTGASAAQRGPTTAYPAAAPAHAFPWTFVWIIGGVLLVLWLLLRRRQAAPPAYYPGTMPNANLGPGGVVPPAGGFPSVMGGAGSGIMGGIASGLAVGAGVAAGEELIHHAFDRPGSGGVVPEPYQGNNEPPAEPPNADMGGPDFGISDGGGWDDGGGGGGGDDGGGWT